MAANNSEVLDRLLPRDVQGLRAIPSVCTAHADVLRIAVEHGRRNDMPVLIEATCNQVNQEGGYTGLNPSAFRNLVARMADECGLLANRLILGGDHLGPNPWKHLPADEAMNKAEAMVSAYVRAGFGKIHLDTSMGCEGEPASLSDDLVAFRAARLAHAAEAMAREEGLQAPIYVIGTEVPPPGGATGSLDHLAVTKSEAVSTTVEAHRSAFERAGVGEAFSRVVAIVVQPGVEFGDEEVAVYRPEKAQALAGALHGWPGLAFEAHSTDYQPAHLLGQLADDGFAILKVGPALTFAWREALYALDSINSVLSGDPPRLLDGMERLMLAEPRYWAPYYDGSISEQRVKRHFSYSDRIRYYWPHHEAAEMVRRLLQSLGKRSIPSTLVSQFLGARLADAGRSQLQARALIDAHVGAVLDDYRSAALAA